MQTSNDLSQDVLLEMFHYDEKTGIVTNKVDTKWRTKGKVATFSNGKDHYLGMSIFGKQYLAHRVIWFMKTGVWCDQVDHKNHNKHDNRWENLRDTTHTENDRNQKKHSRNKSGATGVRTLKSGRFNARIGFSKGDINIGTFDTFDEAVKARKQKEMKLGFHPNHGEKV